eukprot:3507689-Rhodomonas_salina.1
MLSPPPLLQANRISDAHGIMEDPSDDGTGTLATPSESWFSVIGVLNFNSSEDPSSQTLT